MAANVSLENLRPLAVNPRPDPLNGLRSYEGGLDVDNRHYWAALGFSAVAAYVIITLWVLLGLSIVALVAIRAFFGRRVRNKHPALSGLDFSESKEHGCFWAEGLCHNALQRWLLIVHILSIIVLAVIAIISTDTAARRAGNAVSVGLDAANSAIVDATNVSLSLQEAAQELNGTSFASAKTLSDLTNTAAEIDSGKGRVASIVEKTKPLVSRALHAAQGVTMGVAALLLAVGLFSLLAPLRILQVPAWFLTLLALMLAAAYIVAANVAIDGCEGMEEYARSPGNTTWDDGLPCDDLNATRPELEQARTTANELVEEANTYVNQINNAGYEPAISLICEPLPANTSADKNQTRGGESCISISAFIAEYDKTILSTMAEGRDLLRALRAVQKLVAVYPVAESFVNCTFLTDTFLHLSSQNCPPMKSVLRTLWLLFSLAAIPLGGGFLLLFLRETLDLLKKHFQRVLPVTEDPQQPNSSGAIHLVAQNSVSPRTAS